MQHESIRDLVRFRAENDHDRIFISSPEDNIQLTFGQYYEKVLELGGELIKNSLQKGDRVATVLSNGLGHAISFASITSFGAVAVPINPKLKGNEIQYLLENSEAKIIITDKQNLEGLISFLSDLSEITIEDLSIKYGSHGNLKLITLNKSSSNRENTAASSIEIKKEDEALLLYTSGTTGKPKGVVLSHYNLLSEASYIQDGHKLTEKDKALCVLPLFHINGLVVTLITPLFSGGSIVMPEKFSASRFWNWISSFHVTWFSVVPTILSIILSRGPEEGVQLSSLRFARSASASLPVAILKEFENKFGIPVIESYGLSEAGSQVTTNPIPPAVRKPGSVGIPVGNEIRVVDEKGQEVSYGCFGEVVIKGDNITKGYYKNAAANTETFKEGWFYTGDLGYFDEDGYLFLNGRRKELINRAGEKFSPREIDEVLYYIPSIEIAAAVGVPDSLYGEEVVAFVKLRPGEILDKESIISFCSEYLASFKVPKKVFFVDDLPKGPNGKIQRQKLVSIYKEINSL